MWKHFIVLLLASSIGAAQRRGCRCIPGDACWPSTQDWRRFNQSVGGKLVATEHLASVCHFPNYDEARCQVVKDNWMQPSFHDDSSSSIMSALAANNSCDAFTDPQTPCVDGNTVAFAVRATGPEDFIRTIQYAKQRNLRLVIRNTGHEFVGKSTGKGALSIWTHYMKNVDFLTYRSREYTGSAIKLGAGIQVEESYRIAAQRGQVIVGGGCESVGVVGGYLPGGGHSALGSKYGLAVDQVLEWEVVDGRGRLLIANRRQNSDLYWALSGGGPGTFGVVVSVTVKSFQDSPVTAVQMEFDLDAERRDDFFKAVETYHDLVPAITRAGGMSVGEVSTRFRLTPLTLPDVSATEARELLQPLLDQLNETEIEYSLDIVEFPTFYEHWNTTIRPNPTQLIHNAQYAGWMVSKDVVRNRNSELSDALRELTDSGCFTAGIALDVSTPVDNGANPGWRDTDIFFIVLAPWPNNADLSEMAVLGSNLTERCIPALSRLSPHTGTYVNEADPNQPNWQTAYYGNKYGRLLQIKRKYDPDNMFYGKAAVGSEAFSFDNGGRICTSRRR